MHYTAERCNEVERCNEIANEDMWMSRNIGAGRVRVIMRVRKGWWRFLPVGEVWRGAREVSLHRASRYTARLGIWLHRSAV
jgi:hypothetical protein